MKEKVIEGWRIDILFGHSCKDALLALQGKGKLLLVVLMDRYGGEKAFAKLVATYMYWEMH